MGTLAEAIRARAALHARYPGASWVRGLGVGLSEHGYGLVLHAPGSAIGHASMVNGVPVRAVSGEHAPLAVARWRWSGRPAVFDHLDLNRDGVVDEHDLERGLGRGVSLLRGEASGPLGVDAWEGSSRLFQVLDANRDGLVTRADLEDGLGEHAVRLIHGEPAYGPCLPPGSAYGWRANARGVSFADREAKAKYMAEAARHDAEDPIILDWARQFRRLPTEQRAAPALRAEVYTLREGPRVV